MKMSELITSVLLLQGINRLAVRPDRRETATDHANPLRQRLPLFSLETHPTARLPRHDPWKVQQHRSNLPQ